MELHNHYHETSKLLLPAHNITCTAHHRPNVYLVCCPSKRWLFAVENILNIHDWKWKSYTLLSFACSRHFFSSTSINSELRLSLLASSDLPDAFLLFLFLFFLAALLQFFPASSRKMKQTHYQLLILQMLFEGLKVAYLSKSCNWQSMLSLLS